ncbi:hypothetical protein BDV19DRAFT_389848 [Aspergillus venezuelensis]
MSFYEEPELERYSALPHLSWILNLYPDQDRRCVGYDGETGFRCNHTISSRSRKSAARLLEKLTGEVYGNYLDGVIHTLPALAGLLLCDKIHHNHAPLLVARWDRELQEFWDEEWEGLI